MSLIFDALRKASQEEERQRGSHTLRLPESPYDRRTVDMERRRLRQARLRPWVWAATGAGAVALILAGFLCAVAYLNAGAGEQIPVAENAPPRPPQNRVSVEPIDWSQGTDEPAAWSHRSESLPHPFAFETPRLPPPQDQGANLILPSETPVLAPLDGTLPLLLPGEVTKRDPEPTPKPAPKQPAQLSAQDFELGPIVWDENDPMAMVDRKPVRQGDRVSGATVDQILKTSVVLEIDGRKITLKHN